MRTTVSCNIQTGNSMNTKYWVINDHKRLEIVKSNEFYIMTIGFGDQI